MLLVEITENRSGRPKTQFCEFSDQKNPSPSFSLPQSFRHGSLFTSQMLHGQLVSDINKLMHILVLKFSERERERVLFIYLISVLFNL